MHATKTNDAQKVEKTIFGRRRTHRLSPRRIEIFKTVMHNYAITAWQDIKPEQFSDIWLEIGFGNGEHIHRQAQENPHTLLIGAEYFINGIAALSVQIHTENTQNIRIYNGHATTLLEHIPDAVIGRVFILFPDPWHKKRHRKRRFINPETLNTLHRIMRPQATLHIASDNADYIAQTLIDNRTHNIFHWIDEKAEQWNNPHDPRYITRYQRKAIAANRACCTITFEK